MRALKHDKLEGIIHRLAAEFIRNVATSASLLTVTRVELNPSGKDAIIFFTTLPESEEDTALKFLERKSGEFKEYVKKHSRLGMLPFMRWKIDYGERNRQRLDEISKDL
ncbi:MAG: Ribosome-binding factor [Parcubacteria group bacterium]|nr:Ribosome-binding factor [Parcubacteria group bacterium]